MINEITAAVLFLVRLIEKNEKFSQDQIESYRENLIDLMTKRFQDHWFPDQPFKGQGYRCIRVNGRNRKDATLESAAKAAGLKYEDLSLPIELTLWVDPKEVCCRFGENSGSYCTLASWNDDKSKNIDDETGSNKEYEDSDESSEDHETSSEEEKSDSGSTETDTSSSSQSSQSSVCEPRSMPVMLRKTVPKSYQHCSRWIAQIPQVHATFHYMSPTPCQRVMTSPPCQRVVQLIPVPQHQWMSVLQPAIFCAPAPPPPPPQFCVQQRGRRRNFHSLPKRNPRHWRFNL